LREIENWNVRHVEVFAVVDKEQVEEPDEDNEEEAQVPAAASGFPRFYSPPALRQAAGWVEDVADQRYQQVIWLPPVGRQVNETLADVVRRGPRAGGDVTIRVTAAGQVIPPRGPYRSAGNLLTESWSSIWADSAFDRYREHVELPTRCDQCPGLAICAADCPSEERGWATGDPRGT
jgi:radical SAM protein with 4Fe4S-binding SPASM domain